METAFLQDTLVELIIDILSDGKLKVSSDDAMSNSLSNGSIETSNLKITHYHFEVRYFLTSSKEN